MTWTNKSNVLAIDIGNSRVKLLDNSFYFAYDLSNPTWRDDLKQAISRLGGLAQRVVVSSVNKVAQDALLEIFEEFNVSYEDVETLLRKSSIVDFKKVEGMGNDRKLGLIGAYCEYPTPLAVVDCGTAVTVNFLAMPNIAIGGAIFPGLLTQAKSLHQFTSLLPLVDIELPKSFCGGNTDDAIKAGIFASVIGGIKELISRNSTNRFNRVKPKVIITGGYAPLIANNISGLDVAVDANLVLKGIQKLVSCK